MQPELVLFDNPGSTNGLKVRILLAELGMAARVEPVPLTPERPPQYLRIHPFGTVPCLVHGELTITESNTILRYLAGIAGRDDLHPGEPAARARVDMLLDALSLSLRPALWGLEEPLVYALPVVDGELAARRTALEAAMDGWERMLEANAPALPELTIADIAMAGRLAHLERLLDGTDPWPVTNRRLAAVRARPAYAAAVAGSPFDQIASG